MAAKRPKRVLPGFSLTLGYTWIYLAILVLIPLSMLIWKTAGMGWPEFWSTVTNERVISSYKLSFGASLAAGLINTVLGLL